MPRAAAKAPASPKAKPKAKAAPITGRAVVICTAKRGVFFGYTEESAEAIIGRGSVTLSHARNCVYWSEATRGVLGLAGIGPQAGSRIGPRVPSLTCNEVAAVIVCSPEATERWEAGPWT